ncbi:hypothetical protein MMC18_007114 [Xylographa bjoerkii]|nr:hypothetical protein [Xylographa bjoerkii]
MPRKIPVEEALSFLYICLKYSDYNTIDFTRVGEATNLCKEAAQQRFRRLRKQIENGSSVTSDLTPGLETPSLDDSAHGGKEEC